MDKIFTKTERLVLYNQYKILSIIDKEREAEYSYSKNLEILKNGVEPLYDELFSELRDEPITEGVFNEVHDILSMYRDINGLGNLEGIDFKQIAFEGFDHMTTEHYAAYSFIIEILKYYDDVTTQVIDSHSGGTLPKYRKMLEVYNRLRKQSSLTFEGLKQIIAEM